MSMGMAQKPVDTRFRNRYAVGSVHIVAPTSFVGQVLLGSDRRRG